MRSASPSFRLNDCTHTTHFCFPGWDIPNESLGTMQRTWNTQNTMSIRVTAPQLQEKRLQGTQFAPTQDIHRETTTPHSVRLLRSTNPLAQPEEVGSIVRFDSAEAQQRKKVNREGNGLPSDKQTRNPTDSPQRSLRGTSGMKVLTTPRPLIYRQVKRHIR